MTSKAPLMLSVSGARGIVGESMTPEVATRFAAAFGSYLRAAGALDTATVVVGRDGRDSGEALAKAAMQGLTGVGCNVIDIGVSATPTVGVMISDRKANGGMCITASHNPIEWNGLKCLDANGLAPSPTEAEVIIDRFTNDTVSAVEEADRGSTTTDSTGVAVHTARVTTLIDPEPIRAAGFAVVLDSVNASGCLGGRVLLEQYGCALEHLNGELTGVFAHTPEPLEENLTGLAEAVAAKKNAACGFAQDPDADRLAIIDENGRYIGEEFTVVLCALRMLQRFGKGTLAVNLSTSRMIDDVAASFPGSTVLRTAVGEANVATALCEAEGLLGGEGNGGVIVPRVTWVRDSLASMAIVLDLLAAEGRPLSAIVDDLPHYAMIKRKVSLEDVGGMAAIPEVLERVRSAWPGAKINDTDGVRIDLDERWVHVRASNTEPIVRIIAEAPSEQAACALADEAAIVAGLS